MLAITTLTDCIHEIQKSRRYYFFHVISPKIFNTTRDAVQKHKEIIYRTKAGYYVRATCLISEGCILKEYYRSFDEEKGLLQEFLFSRKIPIEAARNSKGRCLVKRLFQ